MCTNMNTKKVVVQSSVCRCRKLKNVIKYVIIIYEEADRFYGNGRKGREKGEYGPRESRPGAEERILCGVEERRRIPLPPLLYESLRLVGILSLCTVWPLLCDVCLRVSYYLFLHCAFLLRHKNINANYDKQATTFTVYR